MNVNLEILKLNHAFKWSDILGTPIEIGQKVVFGSAGSMCLRIGEIVKVSNKTVVIKHHEYRNNPHSTIMESRRNFDDVVVIK